MPESLPGPRSLAMRVIVAATLLIGVLQVVAAAPASASHPAPPGLDHFKCYRGVTPAADPYEFPRGATAVLRDQFGTFTSDVARTPNRLCNPVEKTLPTGQAFAPANPRAHLVCFTVVNSTFQPRTVTVQNQFGTATLRVTSPNRLCVPTWKTASGQFPPAEQPPGLDHFVCYNATVPLGADRFEEVPPSVRLKDQFVTNASKVLAVKELCNPVRKTIGPSHSVGVRNPDAHQVCFAIDHPTFPAATRATKNQFGRARVTSSAPSRLCLPSFKKLA